MYTKQDLIDELKIQLDFVDTVEEWSELYYQIQQLHQEIDIESLVD